MRYRDICKTIVVYPDFARPRVGLIKPVLFLCIRLILIFSIATLLILLNNKVKIPVALCVLIPFFVDFIIQLIFLTPTCIFLIRLYQLHMDMEVRQYCNLTPSCSEYCASILQIYGIYRGFGLCVKRLVRCSLVREDYRGVDYPYIMKKGD